MPLLYFARAYRAIAFKTGDIIYSHHHRVALLYLSALAVCCWLAAVHCHCALTLGLASWAGIDGELFASRLMARQQTMLASYIVVDAGGLCKNVTPLHLHVTQLTTTRNTGCADGTGGRPSVR